MTNFFDYTVIQYENIDSTNAAAKRIHFNQEFKKIIIIAKNQTSGKGRQGKIWTSCNGNFFASFVFSSKKFPAKKLLSIPFATSIALRNALISAGISKENISLKWPNDILVNNKKIAGILIETDNKNDRIVVGIGVNLAQYPDKTDYGATSIKKEIEKTIDYKDFLSILTPHFEEWISFCEKGESAFIINEWQKNAFYLGKKIKIKISSEILTGIFLGLDKNGSLLLKDENNIERVISAGEIIE